MILNLVKSISLYKVLGLFYILLLTSACSLEGEKDVLFLRKNLHDYQAETIPYQEPIRFSLSTEKILLGIEEPIKIDSIHDTDIFVAEIVEQVNSINKDEEIYMVIGLDSHIRSKSGTILSHFRLNDDGTYTTGSVALRAFDENGEIGNFGSGSGDHEGEFEQFILYTFKKEDVMKSKELTFEIGGLYLLNYSKKG